MPGEGENLTHAAMSILNEGVISPPWSSWIGSSALLLVALYLTLLLPRLKAGTGALITGTLLIILLSAPIFTAQHDMSAPLAVPATLLLLGHAVLITKRILLARHDKQKSAQAAENSQGAGLKSRNPRRPDSTRSSTRKAPDGQHPHVGNAIPHPAKEFTLGRYRVTKELGKGAMGLVCLGRDTKTGRVAAIKTIALSREFEEDKLAEVKDCLFREAKTAGRLHHPNIVTIFDAGEEHDLAYIAMEYLKGRDLTPYTSPDHLLPVAEVMRIVASVADALDYAHGQQVVHRDIKPANIMYETNTRTVKVTDFGIARITDSSKTRTGVVLGTPSYMSPEQLSGKAIDGRSDLFSLGVTLYQMLTGQLPFQADSMVALMFRIANQRHQDIRTFKPELPQCLSDIVDRMLEKDVMKRYQRGVEIVAALHNCMRLSHNAPLLGQAPR